MRDDYGHYGTGLSGYAHYTQAMSHGSRPTLSDAPSAADEMFALLDDMMASGEFECEDDAIEAWFDEFFTPEQRLVLEDMLASDDRASSTDTVKAWLEMVL